MTPDQNHFFESIKSLIASARSRAQQRVHFIMVEAYWNVGRLIVEKEQRGESRAAYGEQLIAELSRRLTEAFGKGFSKRNLHNMVRFYHAFQNVQTLSAQLSWSHYLLLIRVDDSGARQWYIDECIASNWSVRALEHQITTHYYECLTLSKEKLSVKQEADEKTNDLRYTPQEFIKDPYVLEFLNLRQNDTLFESDLEHLYLPSAEEFKMELEMAHWRLEALKGP